MATRDQTRDGTSVTKRSEVDRRAERDILRRGAMATRDQTRDGTYVTEQSGVDAEQSAAVADL